MSNLWRRIQYFLNRKQIQRELEEEMAAHRAAMSDPRSFGSTLKLREDSNEAWGFGWFDRLWQDLDYAIRLLRRSPCFTLTAVAILAIGIGLNLTAFGFLNTAMFRPLPGIEEPHTIMRLTRQAPGSSSTNVSYPSFDFYRRNTKAFSEMFAVAGGELTYNGTERWRTAFVTANYFKTLGVLPAYGTLTPAAPGDIVISAAFLNSRFAGDTTILGKPILLNRKAARIIGVAEPSFIGLNPEPTQTWAWIDDHAHFFTGSEILTTTENQPIHLYGRLAPGISPQAAEQALRPIVKARRQISPKEIWQDEYLLITPGAYAATRADKLLLPLLLAGGLLMLVLATACANLGNLLLARGVTRHREFSIRTAIGATRPRLIRQLMTESILLALMGAAAGLALSQLVSTIMIKQLNWPAFLDVAPDWRVILYAFATALLASIFFGLAPALQSTRQDARRSTRLRLTLIGLQAAASCILLILSGLLTRGIFHAVSEQPGFSYAQSIVIDPALQTVGINGPKARLYLNNLQASVNSIPGIESTSLAMTPPLGQRSSSMVSRVGLLFLNHIDSNYFHTMQIPILRGRTFRNDETNVVVFGERAASRLWPNQDPIGQEYTTEEGKRRWTVVGVAGNAPIYSPGDPDAMEIYFPLAEALLQDTVLLVRTNNWVQAKPALERAANAINPAVIPNLIPMRDGMDRRLRNSRSAATAVAVLGFVSLSLSVVGFAGLISFAVTQRTREIGIRLALGATRWQVMRIGIDRLIPPTAIGIAIGMLIAAALGHALRSELYGLSALDPITFILAPALFLATALLFSIGPLSRAAKIDPASSLRHE